MAIDPVTHFIAGGIAGAAGTTITCPLEVVKTRLQSEMSNFINPLVSSEMGSSGTTVLLPRSLGYLRHVLKTEGYKALFRGLSPSLFGIIPTRALYFMSYFQAKALYNRLLPYESSLVHLHAAVSAGIVTSTCTSPIWVVKTHVQLHDTPGQMLSAAKSIRTIYQLDGLKGFYRGLTASYAGTMETAIHFVIYEHLKKEIRYRRSDAELDLSDCMIAAGIAKLTASSLCYPHEVVRTRLRQMASRNERRYHSFTQTLSKVWREERLRGLYGGMSAHLMRVVPNTAIVFVTYEAIVKLVDHKFSKEPHR